MSGRILSSGMRLGLTLSVKSKIKILPSIKQTAAFDTERLDSQHYSAMNGISALVTSALNGPNLKRSMTPERGESASD